MPLLAIEAGASLGWKSYVGPQIAVIGVDTFGASAPGPVVMQHYGFTVENVCKQARNCSGRSRRNHDARGNRREQWRIYLARRRGQN